MKTVWASLVVALGGCTSPNPTKHCSEGMCLNPDFPYCDVEGVVSGEPGTCIAVTCTPGEIRECVGDDAFTCNSDGDGYERVPCDLGCSATPTPHCKYIEPRYLPDVCDAHAQVEVFAVTSSGTLDPNLDATCNGGIVEQPGAPGICVIRYGRIVVHAETTLRVTGKNGSGQAQYVGRPVAFITDGDLSIDGDVDISANGLVNGPGGGLVISGGRLELTGQGTHKAGGGAGGKTQGGAGGTTSGDGLAFNGGSAVVDPATAPVFIGGAAAPRGGDENPVVGGGGGGGAAMFVSCRGTVSVSGRINAGGGGGWGATEFLGGPYPGGAGGAGGYVVLQGPRVEVTGSVFANGGGGGAGTQSTLAKGHDGYDGRWSTMPASGGVSPNGSGGGGSGGAGTIMPSGGFAPAAAGAGAGGGGGSVGFLQTYTPPGVAPMTSGATTSPAFQPNITLKTR